LLSGVVLEIGAQQVVNSLHAIVVSQTLVMIEMLRVESFSRPSANPPFRLSTSTKESHRLLPIRNSSGISSPATKRNISVSVRPGGADAVG
jgi:hypothetical protein